MQLSGCQPFNSLYHSYIYIGTLHTRVDDLEQSRILEYTGFQLESLGSLGHNYNALRVTAFQLHNMHMRVYREKTGYRRILNGCVFIHSFIHVRVYYY